MLNHALAYLARGLSIIPISKDKKPLISWQEFQTRKATEDEVKDWLKQWPEMNLGIVTGQISNLIVVDCDSTDAIAAFRDHYKGDTSIVKTPRGLHYYFQYAEGVRNTVKVSGIDLDIRGEGGYVVAPPSVNGDGGAYRFLKGLNNALDSFSSCFLYKGYVDSKENGVYKCLQSLQTSTNYFTLGSRDNSIYQLIQALVDGHCKMDLLQQGMEMIANNCNPPYDPKEIPIKITSAITHAQKNTRTLAVDVEEFILSTSGYFLSTDVVNGLHLSTREDKKNLSIILKRLSTKEKPLIEKYGTKNGSWRRIEDDVEYIDWQNADESEYPIELPLNIHQLVKLYPSNIIVLAGAPNTGKTSFMLEVIRLNQRNFPVTYLNSEMGAQELRLRLKLFEEVIPLSNWKFKAIERSSNFADVIDPNGFNVIDYMEVYEDFWIVGKWMNEVHKKLDKGIAIIAIQKAASTKKDQRDFGRGGELTLEKPRLYLAMDRGKIKIVKAKIWREHGQNPNGLIRHFNIINGWKFIPKGDWEQPQEKDYQGFLKER